MSSDADDAHTANDRLGRAFAAFLQRLRTAEAAIRTSPSYGSDLERAGGYQHIARAMKKTLEASILQDADFPYFRILDFWQREGGDNPDQRYAFSPVRGGAHYRIWGSLGSARRVEVQLYSGDPWAAAGASVGYLAHEDIAFADDGSFTVELSSSETVGSWLAMPAEATSVFVRHIYDEWNEDEPGEVHIDRVGHEGHRWLPETATDVAERFELAAEMVERAITDWPAFVNARYVEARSANEVSGLIDTYALGGVQGRWMASGHFDLADGEALVLKTWPTDAQYQAIQLTDMWFASLEYGNLVSSLTTEQSVLSPDGAYHTVVCARDPGHANWLDTGGHHRGVFLLRYDGVRGEIPEAQHPSARIVQVDELPEALPGWAAVTDDERTRTRAARRRHLQIRTNR